MTVEIKVPNIGESVTEVTVAKLLVDNGTYVTLDQPLCELESDKATFEVPAEAAGIVQFVVEEEQDLNVGDVLCTIDTSATPQGVTSNGASQKASNGATAAPVVQEAAVVTTSENTTYATGHPSPAAAKLMAEHNITANQLKGTGVDGRILKADVENFIANPPQPKTAPPPAPKVEASKPTIEAPTVVGNRNSRREKMSRIRKTISKRLVGAKNNTAMLTTFNEVDLTEIMALRKQYKELFKEKHGIGLGFMSFFSKACAMALMEFPAVNAYIDGDHIEYHDFVDISIAVSTPKGLVVPVMRNVEQMDLKTIEQSVKTLALKGRDNKLTMEDMTGGTFTISNGGVFGSLQSTPIINPPQSAILGMHKIQQRPMAINGEVKIRPMMYLALSYDHRIIDGKEAVTFLVRVKELLEEPMKLFLSI